MREDVRTGCGSRRQARRVVLKDRQARVSRSLFTERGIPARIVGDGPWRPGRGNHRSVSEGQDGTELRASSSVAEGALLQQIPVCDATVDLDERDDFKMLSIGQREAAVATRTYRKRRPNLKRRVVRSFVREKVRVVAERGLPVERIGNATDLIHVDACVRRRLSKRVLGHQQSGCTIVKPGARVTKGIDDGRSASFPYGVTDPHRNPKKKFQTLIIPSVQPIKYIVHSSSRFGPTPTKRGSPVFRFEAGLILTQSVVDYYFASHVAGGRLRTGGSQ